MKKLFDYINEALIKKDTKIGTYNYFPKDKEELRSLIEQLLEERGKDADLNDIDTADITDMSDLFYKLDPHNIDISKWDVSNVKYMRSMFFGCENLTCDISKWNVSNVEDMQSMFYDCKNFNCDLSKWHISKVNDMRYMFKDCKKFTGQGLENWNVSGVNRGWGIFSGCDSLKNKPAWYKG